MVIGGMLMLKLIGVVLIAPMFILFIIANLISIFYVIDDLLPLKIAIKTSFYLTLLALLGAILIML